MIKLSTDQEKTAVELFAQGYRRSEVVSHFIDHDPDVMKQLKESPSESKFRKDLSDKLITCDPNSTRFAMTKHGDHYKSHKAALEKAISNHYQNLVIKSVQWLQKSIDKTQERIEEVTHLLESAKETTPVGASEYASIHNLLTSLEKVQSENQNRLLERMERIHQKTIAL